MEIPLKSRPKGWSLQLFAVVSLLGLLPAVGCSLSPVSSKLSDSVIRDERVLMGTTWWVQVPPSRGDQEDEIRTVLQEVFDELSRVDRLMSEWRDDSPVAAINSAAGIQPVPVPPEVSALIERSIAFGALTAGAFDITWRGTAHLWRFDEQFRVPSDEQIRRGLSRVDFRKITLEGNLVGLPEAGMAIGLGGIAKGYAIDRAAAVLKKNGYQNFLINGGGDVLTAGYRFGKPWRIGIQSPRGIRTELVARLNISAGAVATSGDYERFRIVDGVRYHHIIDPRTGRPAGNCQSVTVLAPTAEEADVLATAIFVLGPAEGLKIAAQRENVEVLIIDREAELWMTDGFSVHAEFFPSPLTLP